MPLEACHRQASSCARTRQSDEEARALAAGKQGGSHLEEREEKDLARGPPQLRAPPLPRFPAPQLGDPLPVSACPITACLGWPGG